MSTKTKTMRKIKLLLVAAFILVYVHESNSQNIVELPYKALDKETTDLMKSLKEIDEKEDQNSIDQCIEALDKHEDMNVRYNLIFWELSFRYASMKQYNNCLDMLISGQDEGLFYYFRTGEQIFPPYLSELEKLDGYESFIAKNKELKEAANKNTTLDFMVQLPTDYIKDSTYPLMLIMHGGIGNIPSLQHNYLSENLQEHFIVVYTQGDKYFGSYSRVYDHEKWEDNMKNVYHQIISKYSVDTTQTILAGPSAGAYRSLLLGLHNTIPAKGMLLSFSVYPRDTDSTLFLDAADRGLKVALLCGENDWAIQQQKKLGYYLD